MNFHLQTVATVATAAALLFYCKISPFKMEITKAQFPTIRNVEARKAIVIYTPITGSVYEAQYRPAFFP